MDIISLGEPMVEFFCEGSISEARTFHKAIGGDTSNTIIAASRLGSKCGYITRVGADQFGEYLLNKWRAENIDVSHAITVADGFTGIYFISMLKDGQREFTYYRKGSAASTIMSSDLDPIYIKSAKILHTSGITQAISENSSKTASEAIQIAKKNKVKVSFDPNYRTKLWSKEKALKAYEETLPWVDIALPDETYGELINQDNPERIIDYFAKFDVPVIALKLGKRGVMIRNELGETESYGVLDVQPKDTTGAGDAFNGGFLHGICRSLATEEAALLGTVTAGLKIRGRGAVESLPHREEVYGLLKAIKEGKKRLI